MGAFQLLADHLARVLPKHASALELPCRCRGARDCRLIPLVDLDSSEGALDLLANDLVEAFGMDRRVFWKIEPGEEPCWVMCAA